MSFTAKLVLPPGDVDNDGTDEQGTFVFSGSNAQVEIYTVFNWLAESGGQATSIVDVLVNWFENQTDTDLPAGMGQRQGFYIDAGAGQHVFEIAADPAEGTGDQWGDTGDASTVTETDATGGTAIQKQMVLDHYIQRVTIDSTSPATLHIGEYSKNGLLSPVDVVLSEPRFSFDSTQQSSTFDMSLTMIEAGTLDSLIDGGGRRER
ncbi:hypothetical protein [Halorussus sp. AFM4]|uniref:hypothetical protein n=1 Tax=Halorussus sp. AFM4 TaxID=3421651 RepID=UPI003EBCCACB